MFGGNSSNSPKVCGCIPVKTGIIVIVAITAVLEFLAFMPYIAVKFAPAVELNQRWKNIAAQKELIMKEHETRMLNERNFRNDYGDVYDTNVYMVKTTTAATTTAEANTTAAPDRELLEFMNYTALFAWATFVPFAHFLLVGSNFLLLAVIFLKFPTLTIPYAISAITMTICALCQNVSIIAKLTNDVVQLTDYAATAEEKQIMKAQTLLSFQTMLTNYDHSVPLADNGPVETNAMITLIVALLWNLFTSLTYGIFAVFTVLFAKAMTNDSASG